VLSGIVDNFLEGGERDRNIILVRFALFGNGFCHAFSQSPEGRELSRCLRKNAGVDQGFVCGKKVFE